MTWLVKNNKDREIGTFADVADAVQFIRFLAMEESRKEFLTWLVEEMFERKVTSPMDIPENVRELKQYELVDLAERKFILVGIKEDGGALDEDSDEY